MKRRWRAVTVAVDGTVSGELGRTWTRRGAERLERHHRRVGRQMHGSPSGILEPLPGKPLYSIRIEHLESA